MGVKYVKVFGDLLLVVQQIADTFQCLDGSLNAYLDKCLEIIALFDDFTVQYDSRNENIVVNDLAQQALGFQANRGKFNFLEKSDVPVCQTEQSGFWPMSSVIVCSIVLSPAKSDSPVSEIGGSENSRITNELSKTTTTSFEVCHA
jgi:hypothetical protein